MINRGRVILGGVFMRHYDILFDRGAEKIHFTRSNCSEKYQGPYFSENVEFGMEDKTKGNFNFFFKFFLHFFKDNSTSKPQIKNNSKSSQTSSNFFGIVCDF